MKPPNCRITNMKREKNIEFLVKKYWEGETTLEEEQFLKNYFSSGNVDDRFRTEAAFFAAIQAERAVQFTKTSNIRGLYSRYRLSPSKIAAAAALFLTACGGWWWASQRPMNSQPAFQAVAPLNVVDPVVVTHVVAPPVNSAFPISEKPILRKTAYAKRSQSKKSTKIMDAETQKAMEDVIAALALVSSKLRQGQKKAQQSLQEINHIDHALNKVRDKQG